MSDVDRTKSIDDYYRQFLDVLNSHVDRVGHPGGTPISVRVRNMGHQAIRALVEEIHDQGYVLGQLHADGIFESGEEADVAELEQRLGVDDKKAEALRAMGESRRGRVSRLQQDPDAMVEADQHYQRGLTLLQDVEQRAERLRNEHRADRNGIG